jgi:hypothetical protein
LLAFTRIVQSSDVSELEEHSMKDYSLEFGNAFVGGKRMRVASLQRLEPHFCLYQPDNRTKYRYIGNITRAAALRKRVARLRRKAMTPMAACPSLAPTVSPTASLTAQPVAAPTASPTTQPCFSDRQVPWLSLCLRRRVPQLSLLLLRLPMFLPHLLQ